MSIYLISLKIKGCVETLEDKEYTVDKTKTNHNPCAPEKAILTHGCMSCSFCVCVDICECWLKTETILLCSLLFFYLAFFTS